MTLHHFSIVLDDGTTADEASIEKTNGNFKAIGATGGAASAGAPDSCSLQTDSTTTTSLSSLSRLSQKRQKIMEETQRVMQMHQMTQNPNVKASCEIRLRDLKHSLEGLTTPLPKEPPQQSLGEFHIDLPVEEQQQQHPANAQPWSENSVMATITQPDADFTSPTTIALGQWKTTTWGFLQFGLFHPTVMLSLFFPFIALAQVMMRLEIKRQPWIGIPDRTSRSRDAFRIALVLEMVWATINCFIYYLPHIIPLIPRILFWLWNGLTFLYMVINIRRIRRIVRERYRIPSNSPYEDSAVSVLLSVLVIMQMLRQTADYTTYNASCFSENGMPAHVPIEVPESTQRSLAEPIACA